MGVGQKKVSHGQACHTLILPVFPHKNYFFSMRNTAANVQVKRGAPAALFVACG